MCLGRPCTVGLDAGGRQLASASRAKACVDVAFALDALLVEQLARCACRSSGSRKRNDRSSSSHLICQMPSRLASGANTCSDSRATSRARRALAVAAYQRSVCRRDARRSSTTRRSRENASSILRTRFDLRTARGLRVAAGLGHRGLRRRASYRAAASAGARRRPGRCTSWPKRSPISALRVVEMRRQREQRPRDAADRRSVRMKPRVPAT